MPGVGDAEGNGYTDKIYITRTNGKNTLGKQEYRMAELRPAEKADPRYVHLPLLTLVGPCVGLPVAGKDAEGLRVGNPVPGTKAEGGDVGEMVTERRTWCMVIR